MAPPAPGAPAGAEGRPARGARPGVLVAVVAAVLVLDQLTKHWALGALDDGRTIDLVGSLRLRLVFNPGGAFSLFGGGGWGPLISVLAVAVVTVLLWQSRSMASRWSSVALGLVVGGALGNLVDRAVRGDEGFLHGRVVDFVDLQWWPVFNVADVGVVVGSIALVAIGMFGPTDDEDGDDGPAADASPDGDGPGVDDDGPGVDGDRGDGAGRPAP